MKNGPSTGTSWLNFQGVEKKLNVKTEARLEVVSISLRETSTDVEKLFGVDLSVKKQIKPVVLN